MTRSTVKKPAFQADLAQIDAAMAALYALFAPDHMVVTELIENMDVIVSPNEVTVDADGFDSRDSQPAFFLEISLPEKIERIDPRKFNTISLIDRGMSIVLALSYFFKEDDLHKNKMMVHDGVIKRCGFEFSAYPLVKDRAFPEGRPDRAKRAFSKENFKFTVLDIDQFPILSDATPFYWPTQFSSQKEAEAFGYLSQESMLFKKLAEHKTKSYFTFLQVVLLPEGAWERYLSLTKIICDDTVKQELVSALISWQNELKSALLQSTQFCKWFREFPADFLDGYYRDMSVRIKMSVADLKKSAPRFIFQFFLKELDWLLNAVRDGIVQQDTTLKAMPLFTALNALSSTLNSADFDVSKMIFCFAHFKLIDTYADIGKCKMSAAYFERVEHYFSYFNMHALAHQSSVDIISSMDTSDATPTAAAVAWLESFNNKPSVLLFFKKIIEEFEKKKNSESYFVSITSATLRSASSLFSSFSSKRFSVTPESTPSLEDELHDLYRQMERVSDTQMLRQVVQQFLHLNQSDQIKTLQKQFVMMLIQQALSEARAKKIILTGQPVLRHRLFEQQADVFLQLFIEALQSVRVSTTPAGVAGWDVLSTTPLPISSAGNLNTTNLGDSSSDFGGEFAF